MYNISSVLRYSPCLHCNNAYDTAIGKDQIEQVAEDGWKLPYERYPFATCELGGGIQVTHHRRPIIKPMDIYALSLTKLGSGNNLIGYYMYHGNTNKMGKFSTLNEDKATDYPNDYTAISYDFQTAVSQYGEIRPQYRLLNMLHLFVNDFGKDMAPLEACMGKDRKELQYALRTDGKSGFVFVNHYRRLHAFADVEQVELSACGVDLPAMDIKGDIAFFSPVNWRVGEEMLRYATAQPLCKDKNTYYFVEIAEVGDCLQLYADGELVADQFYYGKPWRVPAALLYQKKCYLAVSELKDDFYREF